MLQNILSSSKACRMLVRPTRKIFIIRKFLKKICGQIFKILGGNSLGYIMRVEVLEIRYP